VPGHNNEVDPPQLPPAPGAAAETGAANLGGGALSAAGDGRGGADDVAGQGASAERELDAAMGSILADMMRNSMASPFSGLMGAGLFGPAPLGGLLGGARAGLTSAAGAVGSQLLSAFAADAAVPRQGARSGVISGGRPLRMSMMLASSGPKTDGSGPSEPEVVMSLEVVGSGLSPEEGSSAKGGAGGDAEAAGALMAEVAALVSVVPAAAVLELGTQCGIEEGRGRVGVGAFLHAAAQCNCFCAQSSTAPHQSDRAGVCYCMPHVPNRWRSLLAPVVHASGGMLKTTSDRLCLRSLQCSTR
jgi:hypothetical protein